MLERAENSLKTILVADDEEIVRQMVALILEQEGFRVLQAATFDEAEDLWHAERDVIDLLVTDIEFPRVSGAEMARQFRLEKPDLRVVISSGYDNLPPAPVMDLVNEDDLLMKPYTPRKLIEAVSRHFGGSALRNEAA